MKKVDIYNAAVAVAQDQLDTPGRAAFEARMSGKAQSLELADSDYEQFATQARQVRNTLLQLKEQDDRIAAQEATAAKNAEAAKAAAGKINPATGLAT